MSIDLTIPGAQEITVNCTDPSKFSQSPSSNSPNSIPQQVPSPDIAERAKEFSSSIVLNSCTDSIQMPKLQSKLVQIQQHLPGQSEPRNLLLPMFFSSQENHQRQRSLDQKTPPDQSILTVTQIAQRRRKTVTQQPSHIIDVVDSLELEPKTPIRKRNHSSAGDTNSSELKINEGFTYSDLRKRGSGEQRKATTFITMATTNYPDIIEEEEQEPGFFSQRENFEYEQEIRNSYIMSTLNQEFGEYPTVALCATCNVEVVTSVKLVKEKGTSLSRKIEHLVCCCLPVWVYRHQVIEHSCSQCKGVVARINLDKN